MTAASFKIEATALQKILQMTIDHMYFHLDNDEIRFAEVSAVHRRGGIIKTIYDYTLNIDRSLDAMAPERNILFSTKKLRYFKPQSVLVVVFVEKNNLVFMDADTEDRNIIIDRKTFHENLQYRQILNIALRDGFAMTAFMIRNKYVLIGSGYKNSKFPTDEVHWRFEKASGHMLLREKRKEKLNLNEFNELFELPIIKDNTDFEFPDARCSLKFSILNKYVHPFELGTIALVFADSKRFQPFFIYNGDDISTISTIREAND